MLFNLIKILRTMCIENAFSDQVVAAACFVWMPSCLNPVDASGMFRQNKITPNFSQTCRLVFILRAQAMYNSTKKIKNQACHRDVVNSRCLHSLNNIKSSAIRARFRHTPRFSLIQSRGKFKSPARLSYIQISDSSLSRKRRSKRGL